MKEDLINFLNEKPKNKNEIKNDLDIKTQDDLYKLDNILRKFKKEGKLKLINNRWYTELFNLCPTCEGKGWVECSKDITSQTPTEKESKDL